MEKSTKKMLSTSLAALLLCLGLCGCEPSQTDNENIYQEDLQTQAAEKVGNPAIVNFTEKNMAKTIWEMRDDPKLITYSYISNRDGKFTYLGQSIGYGLPYSTQYTNPQRKVSGYDAVIAQSDPNGLYSGDGLSSTWVMLKDEKSGKITPVYVEQELFVSQFKLPRRLCVEDTLPENY